MKKRIWKIAVDETLEPKLKRKLRRILKPYRNVSGRYGKCELCGAETSWLINNRFVCPLCSSSYGFVKKDVLPDACEVCGSSGEWCCGQEDQHSLCCRHRDAWQRWDTREYLLKGWKELPEPERDIRWEQCFNIFIEEMKTAAGVK